MNCQIDSIASISANPNAEIAVKRVKHGTRENSHEDTFETLDLEIVHSESEVLYADVLKNYGLTFARPLISGKSEYQYFVMQISFNEVLKTPELYCEYTFVFRDFEWLERVLVEKYADLTTNNALDVKVDFCSDSGSQCFFNYNGFTRAFFYYDRIVLTDIINYYKNYPSSQLVDELIKKQYTHLDYRTKQDFPKR